MIMGILDTGLILDSFFFFLPAYVANTAAGFFGGGAPLDIEKNLWDKKRIFGDGKTIKGTLAGVLCGVLYPVLKNLYLQLEMFFQFPLALMLSFGAIGGDILGSFIKRRIGIESGESAPFLDQLDFAVGALFLATFVTPVSMETVIILLLITPIGHLGVNIMGYLLHKKEVPW